LYNVKKPKIGRIQGGILWLFYIVHHIDNSQKVLYRRKYMKRVTKVLGVFLLMGLGLFTGTASGDVVGYFKFDTFPGGGTTFTDDSGRGLMGILGHPFTEPGSAPGPSGEADDFALSLDGRAALVVDDSAEEILNILEPPITLEAWVRASENPLAHTGIISYGIPGGRTGAGGYKLGINPTGNLLFTLFGVVDVNSTIPFPFDGEWHHIAASYSLDDGGVVFYLDGLEVEFIAETRAILNPGTRHLDIGAQHTALGRLNGDIDRVRISTAALTEEELDSVADTVKPVGDNTVAFFDFDEGAPPLSGRGHGTSWNSHLNCRMDNRSPTHGKYGRSCQSD
jgi:hypothetical protein